MLRRNDEVLKKYMLPIFIILICISLLELCIIIYNVLTRDLSAIPWEAQNFFSFITAIICSILASAVMLFLPNVASKDLDEDASKNIDRIVKETIKISRTEDFLYYMRILMIQM